MQSVQYPFRQVCPVIATFLVASCSMAASPGAPESSRDAGPALQHATGGHAEWGYAGDNGPERWASLGSDYQICADGREESPIDLRAPITAAFGPLRTSYSAAPATLVNNGHTVQLDAAAGQMFSVHDRRYELVQMHVHHPSEHLLDGRRFPLEFHLVHRSPDGTLGVIGVFGELGAINPALEPLFASLPAEKGEKRRLGDPFSVGSVLPASRRYLTYEGSLTTPPCTENVDWFVFEQPITVGPTQVDRFETLYRANARPVQRQLRRFVLRAGR